MISYKELCQLKPCEKAILLLTEEENACFELLLYQKESIFLLIGSFAKEFEKNSDTCSLETMSNLLIDYKTNDDHFIAAYHNILVKHFSISEVATILCKESLFEPDIDVNEQILMIYKW